MADKILVEFYVDSSGAIQQVKQFRNEVDEVPKGAGKASKATDDFGWSLDGMNKMLVGSAAGILGATVVLGAMKTAIVGTATAVKDFTLDAIQTGGDFEVMYARLNALMGSEAGGARAFERIFEFSQEAMLTLEEATDAFAQMKAFGLDPMTDQIESLTDSTAKYTGSAKNLSGVVNAVGKAWAKGKLQGESIEMMLERGIPVWELLETAMGKSRAELMEMSTAGELGRQAIKALIDEMGADAFGAAAGEMEGLNGLVSNLGVAWTDAQRHFAESGALEGAKDIVGELGEILVDLIDSGSFDTAGALMGDVLKTTGAAIAVINENKDGAILVFNALAILGRMEWQKFQTMLTYLTILGEVTGTLNFSGPVDESRVSVVNLADALAEMNEELEKGGELEEDLANAISDAAAAAIAEGEALEERIKAEKDAEKQRAKDARQRAEDLREEERLNKVLEKAIDDALAVAAEGMEEWADAVVLTEEQVKQLGDELAALVDDIPPPSAWNTAFHALEPILGGVAAAFGDSLFLAATGDLDEIGDMWGDAFSNIGRGILDDFSNVLIDSFKAAAGAGKGEGMDAFMEAFTDGGGLAQLGLGIGMSMVGAAQESGSVLQGALGGALAGFSVGGPWGALAGGVIGGAMALFGGGDEDPQSDFSFDWQGGGSLATRGHQGITPEQNQLWVAQRMNEFRTAFSTYRGILQQFNDPELWDLLRTDFLNFDTQGWDNLDVDELASYWGEIALPQMMENAFFQAITGGLRNLGATDETINALWDELSDLAGADRIGALQTYIGALVTTGQLIDDMDWNTILDESRMSAFEGFLAGIGDLLDQTAVAMMGIDDLSLTQRAEQANSINDMILNARGAEIQMLQQIDAMQKSINDTIDSRIESLYTGGLSDDQLTQYYADQVNALMGTLRGGVGDPDELARIMAELDRYVGLYAGTLGDSLYQTGFDGLTPAEQLTALLEEARTLANAEAEDYRLEIKEQNDALIAALIELRDALLGTEGGIPDPKNINLNVPPPEISVNVENNIGVPIETIIDNRISHWFGQPGGNIN
jgi:tape measure domain-containing protein